MLDEKLADGRMAAHDVLDLRRVEIDPAHREHVVDSTVNSADDLQERRATRTGLACDLDPVAGAVSDQRAAPAPEVGGDQLSAGQHLEDELRLHEVHAVARGAAEPGRTKLGHAR